MGIILLLLATAATDNDAIDAFVDNGGMRTTIRNVDWHCRLPLPAADPVGVIILLPRWPHPPRLPVPWPEVYPPLEAYYSSSSVKAYYF